MGSKSFDVGLYLFAVSGVEKALIYSHNNEVSVLLGMMTAVVGGIIRDVFLNPIPVIFEKEIDASAALIGAGIVVIGDFLKVANGWVFPLGFVVCLTICLMVLKYHWKLPDVSRKNNK